MRKPLRELRTNLSFFLQKTNHRCLFSTCCRQDFEEHHDNVRYWNTTLRGLSGQGKNHDVLEKFSCMIQQGVIPNEITFVSVLFVCGSLSSFYDGAVLHTYIVERKLGRNIIIGTSLLTMYGKCKCLDNAWRIFDSMSDRNAVAWTAMISLNTQQHKSEIAINLFIQMQCEGILPDTVSYRNVLKACATLKGLAVGKQIHAVVLCEDSVVDLGIGTALMNMYGKCKCLENARNLFHSLPETNTVHFTLLFTMHIKQGQVDEAFQIFGQMLNKDLKLDKAAFFSVISSFQGDSMITKCLWINTFITEKGLESESVIGNALINMYGKCGSLVDAQQVFDQMYEYDVVTWTAMISACTYCGQLSETLQHYEQMKYEGSIPDRVTHLCVLTGCGQKDAMLLTERLHVHLVSGKFELDPVLRNALISAYGQQGSLTLAKSVFERTTVLDTISWNAIISAYAYHGSTKEAILLFKQMVEKRFKPDEITFMSVLFACSHSGLARDGWNVFLSMETDHKVSPTLEHYACIFDLLTRVGWFAEAEYLISNMPYQPQALSFTTLLGACKHQTYVQRVEYNSQHVFELNPDCTASYVTLSNAYTASIYLGHGYGIKF